MNRLRAWTIATVFTLASLGAAWIFAAFPDSVVLEKFDFRLTAGRGSQGDYPLRVRLPDTLPVNRTASPNYLRPGIEIADAAHEDTPPTVPATPALVPAAKVASASAIPADFDIATFGRVAPSDGDGLRDSKPLIVGGTRVGTIDLVMGQGSIVSVDRQRLAALIEGREPKLSATLDRLDGDRVTLDALRNRDVRIRYDPLADALVIESAS